MKRSIYIVLIGLLILSACNTKSPQPSVDEQQVQSKPIEKPWSAPDTSGLDNSELSHQIKYGRELISNTAFYLGPHGSVAHITNGMNCQNCHLDAGTKPYGNNYSAVAANYPKYRDRSGTMESIYKRINDCIVRSLNGKALDTSGTEMQAIKAYIEWVGSDIPKKTKPNGSGLAELTYLDEAANAGKGKIVYMNKCQVCHGNNGEGKFNADNITYQYPPLWGKHSYNNGAGLFRLSRFAGYVKSNMPFGASYEYPMLSDEDAWNVAAYANSQPRPGYNLHKDWPDISKKPVDYAFGPYADTFSEQQHKYGPFSPIAEFRKNHGN